jgi:drug/metabolite transporter (DMT)-like permease
LSAAVLFGISAIPAKELLTNQAAINSPTLYMYRAALIALFSLIFFRFEINSLSLKQYKLIFARGLFVISQWLLLYYALSKGSAGVTVTLGNITPIFVFILAALFLREKVTIKKALTAVAVLALSLLI